MTKYLKKTGSELFLALLEEIGNTDKPIGSFFGERVAHAHYTLTSDIFEIIATNTQKQSAKKLIVLRRSLVKLRQGMGVELVIRFDPAWMGSSHQNKLGGPDVFRLKLVRLVQDELNKMVDFIIDYKPIPRVPKRI